MHRDLFLTWKGEERSFAPTFRFLRRVDAKLQSDPDRKSNLFSVALVLNQGGEALMDIPIAMSLFLKEVGFSASEEECWFVVSAVNGQSATSEQASDYANFALALTQALIPDIDLGKNQEAPASEKPKSRGKRQSTQKLTGQAAI
jgi:hypothetical protein